MVQKLNAYFEAREHFIVFCRYTPEQAWDKIKARDARWERMTDEQKWEDFRVPYTVYDLFYQGFPEKWALVRPIEFEKGVL
jgi:hypothetical protein